MDSLMVDKEAKTFNIGNLFAPHPFHPQYRPDIDGLRAIAVLLVVIYHGFPTKIEGGFIGVDIFFVISGYLISSIIFKNLEQSTFSILNFYERRVRRIFPALLAVCITALTFGWCVLITDEYKELGKHIVASSFFVQNFALWGESGYFDIAATLKPLLHLWSLSIEEQFYLFWPLLLAFLWKRKQGFLQITIVCAVASFACDLWFAFHDPTADYYLPFTRFWELMAGGILAYLVLHKPEVLARYKNMQAVIGIGLIAVGAVVINSTVVYPGGWALMPVLGSFLIIGAGQSAWLNRKVLANRVLVWIGLISYPLYLWHWLFLSFGHIIRPQGGKQTLISLAGSFAAAVMTYKWVELPLRAKKSIRVPLTLAAAMSVVCIAGVLVFTQVIKPRLKDTNLALDDEWQYLRTLHIKTDVNMNGIFPVRPNRPRATLFLGDSQMAQYAQRVAFDTQSPQAAGAFFAVGAGCLPLPDVFPDEEKRRGCAPNFERALAFANQDFIQTVVIGASWEYYFTDKLYYFKDGDRKIWVNTPEGQKKALDSLRELILNFRSKGKIVYVLLGNPINTDFDPHYHIARLGFTDSKSTSSYVAIKPEQLRLRQLLTDLASDTGAKVIDPLPSYCTKDGCLRITPDGLPIFKDGSHFNPAWSIHHVQFMGETVGVHGL